MRSVACVYLLFIVCGFAVAAEEEPKDDPPALSLSGLWNGSYSYGDDGTGRADVAFTAVIHQRGTEITGFIREPNTFGATDDPWLHASIKGTLDPKTRKLTFTKTYDGTSNVKHDVEYSALLSKDGTKTEGGAWKLLAFGGAFQLARDAAIKSGKLSGMWRGTNRPVEGSEAPEIKISLVLLHKGDEIIGFAREPRLGQDGTNPWFHATIKGSFDEKTGAVKLVKSYDGTARATAEEEYLGKLSDKGELEGKRMSSGNPIGHFALEREGGVE